MDGRRQFVDWARGFAVVAMVLWHTADGWIDPAVRSGQGWSLLRFLGGLAAPTFLFLAGTGAALANRFPHDRPLLSDLKRGLEVLLLGYMLRYQTWLIDAAAITKPGLARAFVPLGAGYALLFFALRARERAGRLAVGGALACVIGLVQVPWVAPGRLERLLQIDVLQAIGASLIVLTLLERAAGVLRRPLFALALAGAVAIATEPIQAHLPGVLPSFVAAYFGKFSVAPTLPTPALFPLFPWFAYATAGAAYGAVLKRVATPEVAVFGAVLGALLALATSESYPWVQALFGERAWTVQPLRWLFRVGLVGVVLGIGWLWAARQRGLALIRLGRASLRVYWAHLMVAYGVLGMPFHHRLGFLGWFFRFAVLLALMWLLASFPTRARVRPAALPST